MHQVSSQALKMLADIPERYQITLKRFSSTTNIIDIANKDLSRYIKHELGLSYNSKVGITVFGCQISKDKMQFSRSIDGAIELAVTQFKENRNGD